MRNYRQRLIDFQVVNQGLYAPYFIAQPTTFTCFFEQPTTEDRHMPSYVIRIEDSEDLASVRVMFEAEGIDIVDEDSKAFQLCAYLLDCVQGLEDDYIDDTTIH